VVSPQSLVPDPNTSVRDTLIRLATSFLDLVLSDEPMRMHRVIVAESTRAPRMAELFYESAVSRLKDGLAQWLAAETRSGRLAVQDPEGAAWRFLGAVKGEAHFACSVRYAAGRSATAAPARRGVRRRFPQGEFLARGRSPPTGGVRKLCLLRLPH
jgi:hypothetical protein